MLEKKPFRKYDLNNVEKKKDVYSVRLNTSEIETLEYAKKLLNQPKDSTAIKQLFLIGLDCIQSEKLAFPLKIISDNFRKNKEYTGLDCFDLQKKELL